MRAPSLSASTAGAAALLASSPGGALAYQFHPYGYQSGTFAPLYAVDPSRAAAQSELTNDDSYAASMYYDPTHNLVFITGSTYGTYFDSSPEALDGDVKGAMGMSNLEGGRDTHRPHLANGDCFLGILKLPKVDGPEIPDGVAGMGSSSPWLINNVDDKTKNQGNEPELIYARRFGTPRNPEACSSVLMLPKINDALLQSGAQLKLVLMGHVNPVPLNALEANSYQLMQNGAFPTASNEDTNRGGFLKSIADHPAPETKEGRAYGFVADFDVSLTLDKTFTQPPDDVSFHNAYGALLGGYVLEGSKLVYPVAMAQNHRDPNQLYVVSMHSDTEDVVFNREYFTSAQVTFDLDGTMHERSDVTLGGAGGNGAKLVGGVPKYGSDFFVKVQQLTVTPYQQLMDVEPTVEEQVKRTMKAGWGFGFKLNDADDVRPSAVAFVQGRIPDEDMLLLGGTTRKHGAEGEEDELDAFITKLSVPAPTPAGQMVQDAIDDESVHPTKRIDSTTDRDETVTAICLPPPDLRSGAITHAYVVGSSTAGYGRDSSMAYLLKLRLDDLSIEWKEHLPSIHPDGLGGDVLGEGCAVSPGGTTVYIGGTIDGGSALNTGAGINIKPVGGKTDVFVVAYDTDFGNVKWARQLGTVKEDKLARGGGVACDDRGNVIIMGSTRGALQRPREDITQEDNGRPHLASDVFVMSLSRVDGEFVNAPFTGEGSPAMETPPASPAGETPPASTSGGVANPKSLIDAEAEEALQGYQGGVGHAGAIVGISLAVVAVSVAVLFLASRVLKMRKLQNRRRAAADGDVLRSWDGGDGFGYYKKRSLGGRRSSDTAPTSSKGDWRAGFGSVVKNANFMDGDEDDDGSVHSTASGKSTSSRQSYTSETTKENIDFLSSLRQEANATMKKMINEDGKELDDPRLDSGATIKSLLMHYRDVKKGGLAEDENGVGEETIDFIKGKPPPPPPPRRKEKEIDEPSEVDGLSEFTIV